MISFNKYFKKFMSKIKKKKERKKKEKKPCFRARRFALSPKAEIHKLSDLEKYFPSKSGFLI